MSKEFGQQLWGLGYVSDENEEDDDQGELEEDFDEAGQASEIQDSIFAGVDLDQTVLNTISESTRLRDVYNHRWWSVKMHDCYFAFYNFQSTPIKQGEQIIFSYGQRGNAYLIEK